VLHVVDAEARVQEVLNQLRAHNVLSLPVVAKQPSRFMGIIDVLTLVQFTAIKYLASQDLATQDDNLLAWPAMFAKLEFEEATAGDIVHDFARAQSIKVLPPEATVGEAARALGYQDHRVLVGDEPATARIVSQSDIIRLLHQNKATLPQALLGMPIHKLPSQVNAIKEVASIDQSTPAIQGFLTLARRGISALAVVDQQHKLVGSLSASDLRGLSDETLAAITRPSLEFIQSANQGRAPMGPVSCTPSDTLETAMDLVVRARVHRVWIADAEAGRPVGVLALGDIIRFLLD